MVFCDWWLQVEVMMVYEIFIKVLVELVLIDDLVIIYL